ncbi:MAG: hypothetical protein ACK55I_33375, partial [bacterium]
HRTCFLSPEALKPLALKASSLGSWRRRRLHFFPRLRARWWPATPPPHALLEGDGDSTHTLQRVPNPTGDLPKTSPQGQQLSPGISTNLPIPLFVS